MGEANRSVTDRLADIYTWMREPDWVETASVEWLIDWVERRPVADLAMVAVLMATPNSCVSLQDVEPGDGCTSRPASALSSQKSGEEV